MRDWNERGIILRLGLFHEADLWLKILCENQGLVTAFAFGGAKSIRRFCGCLDVFNTLFCHLAQSKKYINLKEATLLNAPLQLRKNWRNMGVAANCLRFIEQLEPGEDCAPVYYNLLGDVKACLENTPNADSSFTFFFRLKAISLSGYQPSLNSCAHCTSSDFNNGYFLPKNGTVYCNDCVKLQSFEDKRNFIPVNRKIIKFLSGIINNSPRLWTNINLSSYEDQICCRLINNFIEYHVGIN